MTPTGPDFLTGATQREAATDAASLARETAFRAAYRVAAWFDGRNYVKRTTNTERRSPRG